MLIRIANREDPVQTASSDLGLHCLSRPFWQAASIRNFITFTVYCSSEISVDIMSSTL